MTSEDAGKTAVTEVPRAMAKTGKSFSIVWIVPLVAVLIGAWLTYKAISEKGPVITLTFESADGLEVEKTKIKYLNVDIGQVESIRVNEDLATVIVTAALTKHAAPYLTENTRFWVVRARITSGEVSGLGTLLGGAYIEIDPSSEGKPMRAFRGLEQPPVVTTSAEGGHYILHTKALGALSRGAPVYYRQIPVGKVEHHSLSENGKDVAIQVFVKSPYHRYVNAATRFWNAGGIDLTVDANGLKLETASLVSIISGGISFDNLAASDGKVGVEDGHVFTLYDNHDAARKKKYTQKRYWVLEFDKSVRGLSPGAPVEFLGMGIGEVLEVDFRMGAKAADIYISVLIAMEPERFGGTQFLEKVISPREAIDGLVAEGLRAQLKTGNLLTGQLFIDLEFHPNAPAEKIAWTESPPRFPTIQTTSQEILTVVNKVVDRLDTFPIEKMSADIEAVIENLKKATAQLSSDEIASIISNLNAISAHIPPDKVASMVDDLSHASGELDQLLGQVGSDLEAELKPTLVQAKSTLLAMERVLSTDSALNQEATRALKEVADAATFFRVLVDYLERHPDSLIYGKGEPK